MTAVRAVNASFLSSPVAVSSVVTKYPLTCTGRCRSAGGTGVTASVRSVRVVTHSTHGTV